MVHDGKLAEVTADLAPEQGTALVGTIETMAHELELAVIAAGVETRARAPHGSLRMPRGGRRHVTAAQPPSARLVGMP